MILVGCDLHTRKQQVALLNTDTGELRDQELSHVGDDVERFYAALSPPVTVGIESTGYSLWFHALLQRLGHTLLVGEAAKIRAMVVRKIKTDRRDARHLRLDALSVVSRVEVAKVEEAPMAGMLVNDLQRNCPDGQLRPSGSYDQLRVERMSDPSRARPVVSGSTTRDSLTVSRRAFDKPQRLTRGRTETLKQPPICRVGRALAMKPVIERLLSRSRSIPHAPFFPRQAAQITSKPSSSSSSSSSSDGCSTIRAPQHQRNARQSFFYVLRRDAVSADVRGVPSRVVGPVPLEALNPHGVSRGHAGPLAALAHDKTTGNPFFAIQFLSELYEEGLLAFDHVEGRWSWDLHRIRAKGYTENVVDLMVRKLTRLAPETQNALKLLACLGSSAEFTMVRVVYQDSTEQMPAQLVVGGG